MTDIGYAGALIGGILTLLSPCSVMLLPAFFAVAFASPTKLLARTGIFYLGLLVTLVPIGVLAGGLGAYLSQNRGVLVGVASALIIIFGLVQLSGLQLPSFSRGSAAEGTSILSVFLLGAVYGVAGICAGPILGSVLTLAALGGNAAYGGVMLAIYALGMAVPLFVLALVWDRVAVSRRNWLKPRTVQIGRWRNTWLMIISGLLSIGIGLLLLLTEGTASLGGVLTINEQFAAENWVVSTTAGVSNTVFAIVAVVLVGAVAAAFAWRRSWLRRSWLRRRAAEASDGQGASTPEGSSDSVPGRVK